MPFFRQEVLKSAPFRAVFSQHFAEDSISAVLLGLARNLLLFNCRNLEEAHGREFIIGAMRREGLLLR